MQDFQSEIISFTIIAAVVIMLGFYESKIKERNK